MSMNHYIVVHYSEIGLKGKNRRFFEEKLKRNIRETLRDFDIGVARRISGRLIIKISKETQEKNWNEIKKRIERVFGISYFALASCVRPEIKTIEKEALNLVRDKKFHSFRITTKRSEKRFPLKSYEINKKVGAYILKKTKTNPHTIPVLRGGARGKPSHQYISVRVKVDLEKPDLTCFIEIVENYAFLYLEKIKGPGGLPVGVSGRAICLLSGGIDSSVAAYKIMKRGVEVIFVHFESFPQTPKASQEKVRDLVKILDEYQFHSKLYFVPFLKIQKEIAISTLVQYRIILYRRMMFRIAEEVAQKEKSLALITGESVGQVASQTLDNISAISEVAKIPILRPLIGEDKQEIIERAKAIGTYDISILPFEDCCSLFVPKHPTTKANIDLVKNEEKKLKIKTLIREALKNSVVENLTLKNMPN
ncbi:MAG: tRNA 4-thiouridine(8) synthase ThiI [Parcubacteria group bacterium CG23_combo_of_CG06-09_8_20_14_all_35_9]|nr:MAG: tRNA 4-thiouridine(8) synthase ThiI [Parcubacteria group bacterium CG23_combo_of_CG06-09_8_20_14_all_35_9]